jgi:hypothetical protein
MHVDTGTGMVMVSLMLGVAKRVLVLFYQVANELFATMLPMNIDNPYLGLQICTDSQLTFSNFFGKKPENFDVGKVADLP